MQTSTSTMQKLRTFFPIRKYRLTIGWAMAALLIVFVNQYPHWLGIVVALIGCTIRYWASGYIRKNSTLSIRGPYAFTRNPLYFGTFVMAISSILATGEWWLAIPVVLVLALSYTDKVMSEEIHLEQLFGADYVEYKKLVPRLIPNPYQYFVKTRPALKLRTVDKDTKFSWALAWKNRGYEALMVCGIFYVSVCAVVFVKNWFGF